jgi:beta-mannosidase
MKKINLNGSWQLTYGPQQQHYDHATPPVSWPTIPAQVPGNVELDLVAAGVMPDLTIGNNVYLLRQYESYEWWYSRQFEKPVVSPGQRVNLVFEGLDCVADVWLNAIYLGHAANMLVPQQFDITEVLQNASDDPVCTLTVRIHSAVLEGRKLSPEPLNSAFSTNWESISVRKAPHMYGWDIMPRVVTAGLWRDVVLEIQEPTRWQSVYWATLEDDPSQRTATIQVDWNFTTERANVDNLLVRVQVGAFAHVYPVMGTRGRARIALEDVNLWWPRGYGDPALYDAQLELIDSQGKVVDTTKSRVGIRTIVLKYTDVTTPDHPGEFLFIVNGQKVFVKGTNWVPLDAFHSRDVQHLLPAMQMIEDLNCNMIRCWGGNVYEDHAFFSACDDLGVMVWQDFAMACAIYPQTEGFAAVIRHEAEAIVLRLRNHPSLALWAGNNEIDEAYAWAGLGIDPNTDLLSRKVLPDIVRRLDPFRTYLPSSPYRSPEFVRAQRESVGSAQSDIEQPEQHLWGPRNDFKGPYYTKSLAHFASEIGYHGCPDRRSLEQFLEPGHVWPWQNNDQWLTHATRPLPVMTDFNYRIELMGKQISVLFDHVPDDLDDYVLASQISQAEAKKFFVEWFRQGKWRRTGLLWWNLRDGWPIISDAIVDYYGRKKLAYEYIKRVQSAVCVICCEPSNDLHAIIAVNDSLAPANGHVRIMDADSGQLLLDSDFAVQANGYAKIGSVVQSFRKRMWLIDFIINDTPMRNHYLCGPRPYGLSDYRRWMTKLAIPSDIGPTSY